MFTKNRDMAKRKGFPSLLRLPNEQNKISLYIHTKKSSDLKKKKKTVQ